MVKRFINVRELDIDLIDSINPFREGFDVASKALDTPLLKTDPERDDLLSGFR